MKKVSALVGVITLTLLMSSAWAQTSGDYERTFPGDVLPEIGVVLKSERRDCPSGTKFFKNAFPSLTNGQGGGARTEIYSIDNTDVTMTVTWDGDNFFRFDIVNGVAHKVGVKIDTLSLLYNYETAPISGDAPLNKLTSGQAADVNHLDLCLSPATPDTVLPDVTITSPVAGVTVSGTVTVTATVTDEPDNELSSVTASVNGVSLGTGTFTAPDQYAWDWETSTSSTDFPIVTVSATDPSGNTGTASVNVLLDTEPPDVTFTPPSPSDGDKVSDTVTVTATVTDNVAVSSVTASVGGVSLGTGTFTAPDQYEWMWDTTAFSTGAQTITVSATDTSGNTGTDSVGVTVVLSAASCEGLIGDDDPNQAEGCNPSGVENIQLSPDNDLDNCALNNGGEVCTIEAFLLTPSIPPITQFSTGVLDICDGPNAFPDPRVDSNGFPFDPRPLYVFMELGGAPDPSAYPKTSGRELILDEFTFGNPCFAVVYSERNFDLFTAFPEWPNADDPQTEDVEAGLVFIKTQFPEFLDIGPIVRCYGPDDDQVPPQLDPNFDLQETGEATYQTTDKSRMIEQTAAAMTNACFNPKRLSSRDKSFSVLNTKEHCGFDFNSSTGPADVLDCKFTLADGKFDALEVSLDLAAPFLISPKFANLNRKFNQARSQYNKKNSNSLARAIADLKDLLFQVATGDWTVTEENYPGDAQMRIENLIHRVTLLKSEVDRLSGP